MWWRWPPSMAFPVFRSTPSDVPKSACSTSCTASAFRPAARRRSQRESARESAPSRRCGRRPGRRRPRSARPLPSTSRIIAAMRATPTSTRRSDEISLVMNAKPWRSRSWNSGMTRTPATPQTTRRRLGRRAACGRPRAPLDDDDGVHALALDLDPLAARCGRACDGWSSSRNRRARSRRDPPRAAARPAVSASRQPSATSSSSTCAEHLLGRGGDAHRDERRLVVAAADVELQHVERRVVSSRPCRRRRSGSASRSGGLRPRRPR